jgi:Flp pilus assembly pilin Flp
MGKLRADGQSTIEYAIIFAIVAVLSVIVFFPKLQGIFSSYVSTAAGKMR